MSELQFKNCSLFGKRSRHTRLSALLLASSHSSLLTSKPLLQH